MTICGTTISWEAVAAIATICAALAAAIAAWQSRISSATAKKQLEEDFRWRKIERTYSHSPYRSETFLQKTSELSDKYSGLKTSRDKLKEFIKTSSSEGKITSKIDKCNVDLLVFVANRWGQMASEYNAGLLDKKVAKEILQFNFVRFCYVFGKWLNEREDIYANTLKLFQEWKEL